MVDFFVFILPRFFFPTPFFFLTFFSLVFPNSKVLLSTQKTMPRKWKPKTEVYVGPQRPRNAISFFVKQMAPQWADFFRENRILPREQYKMFNEDYKKLPIEERAVFVNLAREDLLRFKTEKANFQGLFYVKKV